MRTAFLLRLLKFGLFQQVAGGFELHDVLCGNLDGFTSAGVTALTGGTVNHSQGAKTDEGNLATLLEFFFRGIQKGVDSFSCINFSHASFFGNGIDQIYFIHFVIFKGLNV